MGIPRCKVRRAGAAALSVGAVVALSSLSFVSPAQAAAIPGTPWRTQVTDLTFGADAPLGSFRAINSAGDLPSSNPYAGLLQTYPTGWGSTTNGIYHPEQTVFVKNGLLNIISKSVGGTVFGAAIEPTGAGESYGARTYGKVVYRMRATGASGHAFAALLWPANDSGKYEFDHEGPMTANTRVGGAYHYAYHGGAITWGARQGQLLSNWHNYSLQWWPGGMTMWIDNYIAYSLAWNGYKSPSIPMRWLIQTGRMWGGAALTPGSTSTVQIAYVKEWRYG